MQNAYFLAKIGADTAEHEQHFAEILLIGRRVASGSRRSRLGAASASARLRWGFECVLNENASSEEVFTKRIYRLSEKREPFLAKFRFDAAVNELSDVEILMVLVILTNRR